MRLRNIIEVIKELEIFPLPKDEFSEKVINSVSKRFNLVEGITREKSDEEAIAKDPILKIAFEEINKDIIKAKEIYKTDLKELIVKSSNLYKHLHHLIERIDCGIPPNAYEKSINEREPATIIEIINAAWFHKLSWEEDLFDTNGNVSEEILEKRERMNRLTLKALEYSDIEIEYLEKQGKPPKYEITE